MSSKNMECTLVKSELLDDYDYVVTIRRQDGSEVRVMIPRENTGWASDLVAINTERNPERNHIFGLNLVTDGHYT